MKKIICVFQIICAIPLMVIGILVAIFGHILRFSGISKTYGMDEQEAKIILKTELEKYREKLYEELKECLDEPIAYEVTGSSGTEYQLEIQIFWDDKPDGSIRVMGSIDDGRGIRAFIPMTDDFIKDSSNDFVGE